MVFFTLVVLTSLGIDTFGLMQLAYHFKTNILLSVIYRFTPTKYHKLLSASSSCPLVFFVVDVVVVFLFVCFFLSCYFLLLLIVVDLHTECILAP